MSIRLYMDVHIKIEITEGLRLRGVDVLTAQDDGTARFDDPALLDRATELGRVLFSQDRDFLTETSMRLRTGRTFAGLIYTRQKGMGIGACIAQLELLAKIGEPSDMNNRVEYLTTR